MAKRKYNPPAEDFLNQQQWRANRSPSRFTSTDPFEPRWNNRISYDNGQPNVFLRLFLIFVSLGVFGFGLFELYQKLIKSDAQYSLAIVVAIVIGFVILIAIFDAMKKS